MGKFEKQTAMEGFKPYKDWELPDIIKWCQENNQIDWLKAKAAEKVSRPVYPRKRVAKMDENGNPVLTKKGKQSYTSVLDKSADPLRYEESPISFVELKSAFLHNFNLCEPKKEKKTTFHDIIGNL